MYKLYSVCFLHAVFDSSSPSEIPEDSPVRTTLCDVSDLLAVEPPTLNVSTPLSNNNDTFDQLLEGLGEGQ